MDDQRIYNSLLHRLNESICVPPYWKKFVPEGKSFKECTNSMQLKKLHRMLSNDGTSGIEQELDRDKIIDSLSVPCETMSFGMTMERPPNGYYKRVVKEPQVEAHKHLACNRLKDNTVQPCFLIEFTYLNERYQEIKNEQGFDFAMLGAEIGGFIGFILGYSLLDFLETISHEKKFCSMKNWF